MIIKIDRIRYTTLCGKHGLMLEDTLGCVVDMDGPTWYVDNNHPSFPKEKFGSVGEDYIGNVMLVGSVENINITQRKFVANKYGKNSPQYAAVDDKVKDSKIHMEAYPEGSPEQLVAAQKVSGVDIEEGVGAELKKLLAIFGITSTPNCSCNAKAKLMNNNGIQWCKENKDTITSWLQEEAKKRKLPFSRFAARKLINFAISRAEKKNQ